jgi:hypothetical protein
LFQGEPLNILSSARPQQPDFLYVLPTFKWLDTASGRKRVGRGLRIYMKRGWFSSGVGELLGVVLMPPGPILTTIADQLKKYVSQWGSDPIFDRNLSAVLGPSQFTYDPKFPETKPGSLGQNLLLAETENTTAPRFVQVQGFTPLFDSQRKLWYVELEFLPTNHYYTFIRLGLCRYQPDSLTNCEISKVVHTEFAQLLADRSATLNHHSNKIDITLAGPSALSKLGTELIVPSGRTAQAPKLSQTRAALQQDPSDQPTELAALPVSPPVQPPDDIVLPPLMTPDPAAGRAHKVVAQIEWRPLGYGDEKDLGWEPLQVTELAAHTSFTSPGIVYWMGSVKWPIPNLPTDREYQLAIREYETYQTDRDVAEGLTSSPTGPKPLKNRLVYVDVFPLTLGIGSISG